ncbi:hypothetical protein DFJ58DRAFT_729449 [Suillus subalutaceus]|uniref:uncharacterized protein n=1 Tax=Suillus subalutaceus TaxID=48586 RepID=UPI001B87A2C3|nr:uncharacterized protein DFJ58DRAFT_729449 [Suillus subalutaceus]KAG1849663.1 hypothetical protein DFJ58DRAFT_729449 [Suillus subalutaceus]
MSDGRAQSLSEPIPPTPSTLLANRTAVIQKYPLRRPMSWRHSLIPRPLLHRLFPLLSPSSSDTPSASFYRLYQFFVIDWTVQFRNELEYFWTRSQPDWALSALPDPYPNNKPKTGSATDTDEALQYAIMAGLCYIMEKAYNRLIMRGLPRDAPPVVDDFEELQARPKHPENVPAWAEAVVPLGEVMDVPDSEGNVPTDEDVDEDFLRFGVRVATPHWVFV